MPEFDLLTLDAFTDRPLAGNPCAVVFEGLELAPERRQQVAREMNLSETAFIARDGDGFAARYYTPAEEVPLAGHPTIAVSFALAARGWMTPQSHPDSFTLSLRDGPIRVGLEWQGETLVQATMFQRTPVFGRAYAAVDVLPRFGLGADDLLEGAVIQTVSTGTPQLMIPLTGHAALRRAQPDIPACLALRESGDFFSVHLFCRQGVTEAGDTFARHFGTPPDLFEDPFTGSATGGMAAYLWHHHLIDAPRFTAEQGHWMGRPGQCAVEVIGARDAMETVTIAGGAVVVVEGRLKV